MNGAPAAALTSMSARARPVWRACKVSLAICVFLAVLTATVLTALCTTGPIEISGLGPRISAILGERFGHGLKFKIGQTFLAFHPSGLSVDIDGLTIGGEGGGKLLFAPHAGVSVDFLPLLSGRVIPKRLEVFDLELRLVLLEDGSLAAAAGPDSAPFLELGHHGDTTPGPSQATAVPEAQETAVPAATPLAPPVSPKRAVLMKEAAQAIRTFFDTVTDSKSMIAGVDHLGVKRGRLVIEDRSSKQDVVYKDLDLEFDKVQNGTALLLSAEGPGQRWSVSAQASGVPGAARHFQFDAKNFSQDEFQLLAGTRNLGFDTDCLFSATFKTGLDADNILSEAVGRIEAGPGFFRLEDPDQEPSLIDDAGASFHWDGKSRRIELDQLSYHASTTRMVFNGSVVPPLNEGQPWALDLGLAGPAVLGPDRLGDQPVVFDRALLTARLFLSDKKLLIDKFVAGSGQEGGATFGAQIDWVHGPHVVFNGTIVPTSVRILKRTWPAFVAAPVRTWVVTHCLDGTVQTGTLRADYNADDLLRMRSDRAPPDNTLTIDMTVTGGALTFLPGVPAIENVVASGHITGRESHFALSSGTMNASGKTIDLTDAGFTVLDSDAHPTPAEIKSHVSGSVEAISDVMSREAFKAYAAIPLDPATLKGQVDGHFIDKILIDDVVRPEDNILRVNATVTNFSADKLIGKEKLDNATITLAVDPAGLRAAGRGKMFGGPATFEMSRAGDKPVDAVVNVTLDEAARAKLGLAVIPGLVGPMNAKISASLGPATPDKVKAQIDLDLAKTAVTSAFLGLAKPAGKPAKVSFGLSGADNHMVLDPVLIDVGTLQGRGSIELGPDNGVQSAHFTSLKVSPGDDMKVDAVKVDETIKLTIRGNTIDGRPFLHALTQVSGEPSAAPAKTAKAEHKEIESAFKGFEIDLKSALLTGYNKQVMTGADLHLSKRGSLIQQFSVTGKFGRAEVVGSMANQRLKITAQDAGALVSFIDLYRHLETGQLTAVMRVGDDTLDGTIDINHFVLRDEPSMKQLVAQTAEDNPQNALAVKGARNIDANAVTFTKLRASFQRNGSHLELHDATMYGSAIGISVDGWLDFAHDRVGLSGTFVPVFAINNFFTKLPVLGFLIGGGTNEGLIAITFRISGLASSPTLSVNPLSVLPGNIFRKIFGALDSSSVPEEPQQGLAPGGLRPPQ